MKTTCPEAGQGIGRWRMSGKPQKTHREPSWSRTVARALAVCAGAVAILLPAWLPDRADAPMERGTVEFLQAALLAASSVVMFGAMAHAGKARPVCRVMALLFLAAFFGEIEDLLSDVMKIRFPLKWVVGVIAFLALTAMVKHRGIMVRFIATLGNHAGSGLIAAALLILYVFNRVIGRQEFWKAALGGSFSKDIPIICRSYLELLGCYLLFIGALGLSITLARRPEPS